MNPITLKLREENVGRSLEDMGTGDYFLKITLAAQTLRSTINKWNLLKLKSFSKQRTLSVRQNGSVQRQGEDREEGLYEQGECFEAMVCTLSILL